MDTPTPSKLNTNNILCVGPKTMSTVSDYEAPVPYVRQAKFEAKETKFTYDQFAINMKTVKTNEGTAEEL